MKISPYLVFISAAVQTVFAATVNVPAGGNLQSALNAAQPGDTIVLASGASYVGNFYLAPNPGPQSITIQSSAMSSLPAAGNRVSNSQSAAMPKLVSPNGSAALVVPDGANFYHIIGIEFLTAPGLYVQDLIDVGTASDSSTAQLPHDIDFDRDYIHGDPVAGGKRGIALNGGSTVVENSYLSGFVSTWQDTQAICGWDGPGPYKIINNYLEAGTENVAFGGSATSIPNVVPSDILVQNNTFYKPLSWKPGSATYVGVPIWVKNQLELKNAQRVTIDSNTFENTWVGADQPGYTFVFTVRTESGAVPWAVVRDITITNNVINHSGAGAVFAGHDSDGTGSSGNFLVQNNVWEDINSSWGGNGHLFVILNDVQGITIDHNTAFQTGAPMLFDIAPSRNLSFTNNITLNGWGVVGDGTGQGLTTLNNYAPGWTFAENVLIGAPSSQYPANNFFPVTVDQVGFLNFLGGIFQLLPGSPYKNAGTDGKDIGANLQTQQQAPPPIPTPAPAPSPIPTGWVNIISKLSGKCLDVTGISVLPGAILQQWACWGGDNQKFMFTPVTGGYEITVKNSGLQLDVAGGPSYTFDGDPIIQWPYWGGTNEIWQANPTSDGYVTLNPQNSGKCMNVSWASTDDGATVVQYACVAGADNEKWALVPVSN